MIDNLVPQCGRSESIAMQHQNNGEYDICSEELTCRAHDLGDVVPTQCSDTSKHLFHFFLDLDILLLQLLWV